MVQTGSLHPFDGSIDSVTICHADYATTAWQMHKCKENSNTNAVILYGNFLYINASVEICFPS